MANAGLSRRLLLRASAVSAAAYFLPTPTGQANVTETYANVARADDIARQWPDGRDAPQIILDVADYMRDKPWLSLGATRLVGDRMDDHWIENGADLWRDFGCFMRLPEGSRVAQWFREGEDGPPPVVLIGSEGEQRILAPDLEAFLAAWALVAPFDKLQLSKMEADVIVSGVPVVVPSDLLHDTNSEDDDEPVADGRPDFARFLEGKLGKPLKSFLKASPDSAPFKVFFDSWGTTAQAEIAANNNLKAIAEILDSDIPRGGKPWDRTSFKLAAIDNRLEIGGKNDPRNPMPEAQAAAIRPLVMAERTRRAEGVHAPRGLWHSAFIYLRSDGTCQIPADWSSPPKFFHGPPATGAELAAELAKFPRSPRWREPWMAELP